MENIAFQFQYIEMTPSRSHSTNEFLMNRSNSLDLLHVWMLRHQWRQMSTNSKFREMRNQRSFIHINCFYVFRNEIKWICDNCCYREGDKRELIKWYYDVKVYCWMLTSHQGKCEIENLEKLKKSEKCLFEIVDKQCEHPFHFILYGMLTCLVVYCNWILTNAKWIAAFCRQTIVPTSTQTEGIEEQKTQTIIQ